MDSSFFEYRDKTSVESESDGEIIDNSLIDESFASKKKFSGKNHTIFVAESDEFTDDETDNENTNTPKPMSRKSGVTQLKIQFSSEDDADQRGSTRQSTSFNNVVVSSSSEDEHSPEMLPKRRPPIRPKSNSLSDSSIIGRKKNKRMMLLDSDTENSIIIEHNKHNKIACLKDTPLKIDVGSSAEKRKANLNSSVDQSDDEGDKSDGSGAESDDDENESDDNVDASDNNGVGISKCGDVNDDEVGSHVEDSDPDKTDSYDHDGLDEDQMVMSRATRMSIMGMIPKENDSDDSDFIQSDEKSRASSVVSSTEAEAITHKTPEKTFPDNDTSRLTCSPFSSPLHDITNCNNESRTRTFEITDKRDDVGANVTIPSKTHDKVHDGSRQSEVGDDVTYIDTSQAKDNSKLSKKEIVINDDVTIVETTPEIIALSSDDEDEKPAKKSPAPKKSSPHKESTSRGSKGKENTMQNYLLPPSYPNQVVYVKRHVRENELSKLEGLKADLHNIRNLLENMDMNTLPDGGVKLIERLTGLEHKVRLQGDKVASMLVEPESPTAEDIAKDGFDSKTGLSWDELQKGSIAVQPRMFGKQAMATHMAERSLILDRLRDLHESLASRPAETAEASPPAVMKTQLMAHQLHALAWLQWRETQRPCGGILADDMGLGKTITMIALVVADMENNIGDDDDDDDDGNSSRYPRGGTLVVCPASLMQQWAGEVKKHCRPRALTLSLHHGAAREHAPARLANHDLVLTTYNLLQRDGEKNGVLMKVRWRRVILDEAHIVRNHKSATARAVAALRGRRRWGLTGTPVHNKDLDLLALLQFLRCTPFDDLTMWKKWIDNKSMGGQERLSTIMRCILLRRTKQQLQQKGQLSCLPDRTAHQREVTLDKEEMNVYQKVLVFSKTLFAQFLHQRAEKQGDTNALPPGKDSAYAKMHKKMIALQGAKPVKSHEILVLLLRLRQVCCHCGLIAAMLDEETASEGIQEDAGGQDLLAELNKLSLEDSKSRRKSGNKEEEEAGGEVAEEGTTAAEAIRSVLSPNNPVFDLARQSSKIRAVMDCLNENVFSTKGDKAVVVSQWTSVLRLVEGELKKARIRSVTLSGSVPVPARPPLIQALNDPASDVRVMLLSLCAGGVGLNLCGANHLLLLDPHWNPQLEEQAQDRVYRVGQGKPTHIYRFMCVDTVEQSIRKLQQSKLELADNVLTGARQNNASKLSIEDLKMLFNMGQ